MTKLVERLESENSEYWKWTGELVEHFFDRKVKREDMLNWIKQRWWNEVKTVEWCSQILLAGSELMGERGDFDLLENISKQVWDEARHYRMLGKCILNLGGDLRFHPHPSWVKLFDEYMKIIGKGNIIFGFAGSMFTGEGSAAITSPIIVEKCADSFPELAHAYAVIDRDERFHKSNGQRGIQKYASTPEMENLALEAAAFVRETQRKAWKEIYGEL